MCVISNSCGCIDTKMLQRVKYGCTKVSRGENVGVGEEKGARVLPDDRSLTDT